MVEHWLDQLTQAYIYPADTPRVIIIHPHATQPHLALKILPHNALYLRFNGTLLNTSGLEQQFNAVLGSAKLESNSIVILDETDRAQPEALSDFIAETLLGKMKYGCVVLLTRSVPLKLNKHPALRGYVSLLPSDDETMLSNYAAQQDPNEHLLEVWALGGGRALMNGRAIDNWDGVLPRALFYYLVDRGMTTRTEIFNTFWSNLPAKEATNVFHVTKRKVNELLGVDLTIFESGFYRIDPKIQLRYDVSLFNQFVQQSEVINGTARRDLLIKAIALYRAPFIHTLKTMWANVRRNEMAESYADTLMTLAKLHEDENKADEAFIWYLRAFQQQPNRAEIVERILRLSSTLLRKDEAHAIYQRHLAALDGSAPKAELVELYNTLS